MKFTGDNLSQISPKKINQPGVSFKDSSFKNFKLIKIFN